jgi:hypothetical protein
MCAPHSVMGCRFALARVAWMSRMTMPLRSNDSELPLAPASSHSPRQALGFFFRLIAGWIESQQHTARVRELVSENTRRLIDQPPGHFQWIGSEAVDEIERAIGQIGGDPLLEDLGLELARRMGGGLVKPMLRAAFVLFGDTPSAAFGNLGRFYGVATRGIVFRYLPLGDNVGVVEARFAGEGTPPEAIAVLRGSLRFIFEATRQEGEVSTAIVDEESIMGTCVRYRVRWAPTETAPVSAFE